MVKKGLTGFILLLLSSNFTYAYSQVNKEDKQKQHLRKVASALPDSVFKEIKKEDLLNDEVYIKLAHDGWYPQEISRIMDNYLKKNRKRVRGSVEYGKYAKQWLPSYAFTPGGDSIYQFVDTTYSEKAISSVRQLFATEMAEWDKEIPYSPDDRLKGIRRPGYFRPVQQKPYTGRIHWIVVHPTDPDALMVVPDGAGIFRTADLGRTWDCVTDRIPDREFRKICAHSAIPVDPDDWNHFFAFMKNGSATAVYETTDGGQTWTRIEEATHKSFKRGYGFKDSNGTMKFIGALQSGANYLNSEIWYSENKGVNWTKVTLPDDLKETHPETGMKGSFFQNFAFHPTNRDKIYITTSRSIYYSEDGLQPQTGADGTTTFNIRQLTFNVLNQDGTEVRASNVSEFPFKATTQSFLEINPENPQQMWFATASRNVSYGVWSAVYYSEDGGHNWRTLQEPMNGIGSGLAFGNESPWGWLGGFGVNFQDPQWLYGCSMSSAISSDGGLTFREFAWGNRLKAMTDDGSYYYTTSSRHNADNHCIVSHRSGRVFRGSDSGLLMKDKNINNHEWTNIGGTMGNQLHYSIKVNEFGDQTMLGNTQDVDAQTYRYGRWGNWRGYEGTEAFINPYAGTCHFSGAGGGDLEGVALSSWYEGYTMADVTTGFWYLIHNPGNNAQSFFRIEGFGRKTINLSENTRDDSGAGNGARDFALTRDGDGGSTLFVMNTNNTLVRSTDNGNTFETVYVQAGGKLVPAKFTGAWITTDPNNSQTIYIGQKGKVLRYNLTEGTGEDLSQGLPNISCEDLIFHEGSGDLYFFSSSGGIYLRNHESGQWSLWMRGYNPLQAKRIALNYTTQELVIGDYGRGVWVADLEHPSDRYFKDGFALKELSETNGRRTLGIDTHWTIPMYYNYKWTVNDEEMINPYQYLTRELTEGDRVRLELTLRESPDVKTVSAEYTVKSSTRASVVDDNRPGMALHSNGRGRVDLGYVDYFYNDFTLDLWVKPESNGVILCNRPVAVERDTRGWALLIEGGKLKFRYAPAQLFNIATYDQPETQQTDLTGGNIEMGKWTHIALTMDRDGDAALYVDGQLTASGERIVQWASLNSAVNLSLFADGFESLPITGAVDELKIWNKALNENDVQRAMFGHDTSQRNALVYYNNFNAGNLALERERFSGIGMHPRTEAVTDYMKMPVAVGAEKSEVKTVEGRTAFDTGSGTAIWLTPAAGQTLKVGVYRYANLHPDSMGVDNRYYTTASEVFQIRPFETSEDVILKVELPLPLKEGKEYQLYGCGLYDEQKIWRKIADLKPGPDGTTSMMAEAINAKELTNRILAVLENKPAVEAQFDAIEGGYEINVYDELETEYTLSARLVGQLDEPTGIYELTSRTGLFRVLDNMKFINGKASARLVLDMDRIRKTDTATDTIESRSGTMVPLSVKVNNRLMPVESGRVLTCNNGGAALQDARIAEALNGRTSLTITGWIRLDHTDMLRGVKPLIFFRNGGGAVCGLHLADGNIRFHWNDGYYGWGSNLNITTADLGRWMHVAFVAEPNGFRLYLNGAEHVHKTTVGAAKITSALMLGQNYLGDKWFKGAIDQVTVWNRALTADEVRQYMTENPRLDGEGLVALIDMDHYNDAGNICDYITGSAITKYGVTSNEEYAHLPYHPTKVFTQEGTAAAEQEISLEQMVAGTSQWRFRLHNGTPYNYISQDYAQLNPIFNEYVLLTADKQNPFGNGQTAAVCFNRPQSATDKALLAIRPSGSHEPFANYIPLTTITDGKMYFNVDATLLNGGVEMMLMYDATNGELPVKATLSADGFTEGDTIFLDEATEKIVIKGRITSKNADSKILVSVVENEYARTDVSELDLNEAVQDITIQIDKEALDKMGVNPLTVVLSGVSEPAELKLNVALEPIINLSLADGDETGTILADAPYPTLNIRAELVQGVLRGEAGIRVTTNPEQIGIQLNTGAGNLLNNSNVRFAEQLQYWPAESEFDAGWNLIGNPFLTNINMTKEQNVLLNEDEIVKYLYQYNAATDTYTAWDMVENYDETQRLMPLEPFFIQTRQPGASLTITPEAKNTAINRRVFAHYMLHESKMVRLGLFAGNDTVAADRTEIKIQDNTDSALRPGEDALKMWGGMNGQSNELATVCDGRYAAINVLPEKQTEVPLYLRLSTSGKFRIAPLKTFGFGLNDRIELLDRKTGKRWNLLEGNGCEFEITDTKKEAERFVLAVDIHEATTDIGQQPDGQPQVVIEGTICRIEGLKEKAVVEIFDTAGRRIAYDTADNNDYFEHNLQRGNYIVRVRTSNKDYSTKINVR